MTITTEMVYATLGHWKAGDRQRVIDFVNTLMPLDAMRLGIYLRGAMMPQELEDFLIIVSAIVD